MTIINLLIIVYTIVILKLVKDWIIDCAKIKSFENTFGQKPDQLNMLAKMEIAEAGVLGNYLEAFLLFVFRFIGYSIGFGILYGVISLF